MKTAKKRSRRFAYLAKMLQDIDRRRSRLLFWVDWVPWGAESNGSKHSAIMRSDLPSGVPSFNPELKERYFFSFNINPDEPITFLGRAVDALKP